MTVMSDKVADNILKMTMSVALLVRYFSTAYCIVNLSHHFTENITPSLNTLKYYKVR